MNPKKMFTRLVRNSSSLKFKEWTSLRLYCGNTTTVEKTFVKPCKFQTEQYEVLLQECCVKQDLAEGKWIHAHLIQSGYIYNPFLANNLMTTYLKCGDLESARQVFDKMPLRRTVTWNTILGGYSKDGYGEEALQLFCEMLEAGEAPNRVSFVSVIKACAAMMDAEQGKQIHSHVIKNGLASEVSVGSALVDMYTKCLCILDANTVFDQMSERNVISWTSMIAGYGHNGYLGEAVQAFSQMLGTDIKPNEYTLTSTLAAVTGEDALEKGQQLHSYIAKVGLDSALSVGNALLTMYANCSCVSDALKVFLTMPERDIVTWNALTAGYARNGHEVEALELFLAMQHSDMKPNHLTISSVLKGCVGLEELQSSRQIHAYAIKGGFESDVIVGTDLVNVYGKCWIVDDARKVFEKMSERNVASWTAIMKGYVQKEESGEALNLFCQMQSENIKSNDFTLSVILSACADLKALKQGKQIHAHTVKAGFEAYEFTGSALLIMYAKSRNISDASKVFNNMHEADIVSATAMITGYALNGYDEEAYNLFHQIHQRSLSGKQVPGCFATALIALFTKCGNIEAANEVSEMMHEDYDACLNATATEYTQHG